MPRKRRLSKLRLDVLTADQRSELCSGVSFFGDESELWEDDDHRRLAWQRHREEILATWDRPGARPVALWEYDLGDWQRYGESEADAVYQLLKAGQLTGCRFNGNNSILSEGVQIERDWRHEISVARLHGRGPTISRPLPTYGTPPWFYKANADGPRNLAP